MCDNRPPRGTFDLFATEGGTAAMCYLFDSLQENFLLDKGDGIALMVPAFTPYIEIPQLSRYQFNMIELHADLMTDDGFHLWQYNDKDIDRLKDRSRHQSALRDQSQQSAQLRPQPGDDGTHCQYREE